MKKVFLDISKSPREPQENDYRDSRKEKSRCYSAGGSSYMRDSPLKSGTTKTYKLRLNSNNMKNMRTYSDANANMLDKAYLNKSNKADRLNSLKRSMDNNYDQNDLIILKRNFLRPKENFLSYNNSRNLTDMLFNNGNEDSSHSNLSYLISRYFRKVLI